MNSPRTFQEEGERIYQAWAHAYATKDLEAVLALYAPDAVLESPLVNTLLKTDLGVIEGRENLRPFVEIIIRRTPPLVDRYRQSFFTDGKTLIWEYPRITPSGQKADMAEVMEIEDGLIKAHRIYWGWYGTQMLQSDAYRL